VSLLVTPQQAAKLVLGQSRGNLHLMLRNPQDTDTAKTRVEMLEELWAYQDQPVGEQVSKILEGMGKFLSASREREKVATAPKEQVKKAKDKAPAAEPAKQPLIIRTLRGSNEGYVQIQP
jgi:hypothetical protein